MRIIPACLILASLFACTKPTPIVKIVRVEVPVAVPCPEPPHLARPVPLSDKLPTTATPDQKAKALVADLCAWFFYALEQEALLDAYRQAPPPKEPKSCPSK